MAPSMFLVTLGTLVFMTVLVGNQLEQTPIPQFRAMETPVCKDGGGFVDGILCAIHWVMDVFRVMFGVILFFGALIAFDVAGAPWYARILVTATLGGGLLWDLIRLFRGTK